MPIDFDTDDFQLTGGCIGVGGRFEVLSCLYVGPDTAALGSNTAVAVKVVADVTLSDTFEAELALKGELGYLERLDHDNIVQAFGLVRLPDGRLGLVLEKLPMLTLGMLINRCQVKRDHRGARRWDSTTKSIFRQLLRALQHAHDRGVIHNDITPENVLIELNDAADDVEVFLIDFEMAGDQEGGRLEYSAPERLELGVSNRKTDLYAAGILLCKMLSGTVPYPGADHAAAVEDRQTPVTEPKTVPAQRVWSTLPSRVQDVLARVLAVDPNKRPKSAAELARMLGLGDITEGIRLPAFLVTAIMAAAIVAFLTNPFGGGQSRLTRIVLERDAASEIERCVQQREAGREACTRGYAGDTKKEHLCEEFATDSPRGELCSVRRQDMISIQQCLGPERGR